MGGWELWVLWEGWERWDDWEGWERKKIYLNSPAKAEPKP